MKKKKDAAEVGLAFLDVICCGFGAIILLLLITRLTAPQAFEDSFDRLLELVRFKQQSIEEIVGRKQELKRSQLALRDDLDQKILELATLEEELLRLIQKYEMAISNKDRYEEISREYLSVKQSLTEEQQRLISTGFRRKRSSVGGIPVDSEYVIFVIDTSGSMQSAAWSGVVRKVGEALRIYPKLKGIQVVNDDGIYMFPQTRSQWIKDSPARRQAIMKRLSNWAATSNSSPVEGIQEAIRTYYDPKKNISIYYFGDDFRGRSIEAIADAVDFENVDDEEGNRRVRIHAVGFPVYIYLGAGTDFYKFSSLMRELAVRNNGTFIGLPSAR